MTDITELAQSLKRRATSANEFGESLYVKGADVIALVEALEKAQQRITELESRTVKLPSELELRNNEVCSVCAGNALQVIEDKLTAAGIKWEAE